MKRGILNDGVMSKLEAIKAELESENENSMGRLMVSMSSHGGNCKGCSGSCQGGCRGNCDGTCIIQ